MPETLELILWCAALAIWLMLFFGYLQGAYNAIFKASWRRLVNIGLKAKAK